MEGKKCAPPPSEPSQKTETPKEEKKGLNWAAGSFVLTAWRTLRDALNAGE
ncbi:hypothetical protein LXH09_01675 [Streptomyces sp. CS7]|uniref:hypothetical protein n=1 Tax=unclassified Streptomyces TaxID=2593676 RepID=UPI00190A4D15|nr:MULTISPECIES: hypothetical protein [unclassified Streptomyces]MBK3531069.1 hypothetical protein [Streptomyces sp. MBT72]MBK3535500.1 hypothetical protein [Streptomyces sp. MBT67]MBK3552933.1 hypothetical protein [Streptomyces sp. MBT61]MCT6775351.1 hypothetical protein [Streptomyces sp. CS-7]